MSDTKASVDLLAEFRLACIDFIKCVDIPACTFRNAFDVDKLKAAFKTFAKVADNLTAEHVRIIFSKNVDQALGAFICRAHKIHAIGTVELNPEDIDVMREVAQNMMSSCRLMAAWTVNRPPYKYKPILFRCAHEP